MEQKKTWHDNHHVSSTFRQRLADSVATVWVHGAL